MHRPYLVTTLEVVTKYTHTILNTIAKLVKEPIRLKLNNARRAK